MANKNNSKAALALSFDSFNGIDVRKSHCGTQSVCDINNFCVTPSGSLKKRSGYRAIFSSDKTVRAVWSGIINGNEECYFIARQQVYRIDPQTKTANIICSISSSEGDVEIFYFIDSLYIADGKSIYKLSNNIALTQSGYVPLLGKDWSTGKVGEINEPLNILTRRARITYDAGESPTSYLATLYPVQSIDAVYKNGVLLSSDAYSYKSTIKAVSVADISPNDKLELNLTYTDTESELREELLSSHSASVFGGINNTRLFLWNGSRKNKMYTTSHVSDEDLAEAQKRYANCGRLYFPKANAFTVGSGRYAVRGVTRHFDRLLILTENDAWMADSAEWDVESFPTMNVNSNIGCSSQNGVDVIKNTPISVGAGAIYQWTNDTDELNDANAYSISAPISEYLPESFFKNAVVYADKERMQMWFCDAYGDGSAWIYDLSKKAWFRFSNLYAKFIFKFCNEIGFCDGNTVYLFDSSLYEDIDQVGSISGTPIKASLVSGILDFGTCERKRLSSICLRGDSLSANTAIGITTDTGEEVDLMLDGLSPIHSSIKKRLFSHRFNDLTLCLIAKGDERQIIHSITVEAR